MFAASQIGLAAVTAPKATACSASWPVRQTLAQRIDRYRTLPEVLALDVQLQGAGARSLSTDEVGAEPQAGAGQRRQPVVHAHLLNSDGMAVAASNWRDATSNVGENYSFAPMQQALARRGSFYGISV